jgi:MerR family transcriptional regulator, light-induced transcriptional regulator
MENVEQRHQPRHPIRVVAQRTGLTPEVLRAWEHRYGGVEPRRAATGRRLYSDAEVERLRLLRQVTDVGRPISQVATLADEELVALAKEDAATDPGAEAIGMEDTLEQALAEVQSFNAARLEALLMRAVVTERADAVLDQVVAPLLREVGVRWQAGTLGVAHEHMASAVLRRVLGFMADTSTVAEGAPELVVATPATEVHEFGALLVAATAASAGWRVIYLGPDIPAEDVAVAVRQRDAHAVALSIVFASSTTVADELRRLRAVLPADVEVWVGGAASDRQRRVLEETGALHVATLPEMRRLLGARSQKAERGT